MTSAKVKDGSLLARDFKTGAIPAGPQGPKGDKGDKGDPGQPATRLWARVNTDPASPVVLGSSGVTAVVKDPTFNADGIL